MTKQGLTTAGKRIKKRLIDKGMTQTQLAEQIGCSKQYLNNVMHGFRSGKKYLPKIYEILDMKESA